MKMIWKQLRERIEQWRAQNRVIRQQLARKDLWQ
jgi:hypothetical protein